MARKVKEWIAKHDDQKIPDRVRLRVFDRFNGVCQLSNTKINVGDKWECDHKEDLWKGGEHRESNLQPVLIKPHKIKSARGKTEKATSDKQRKKHIGITQPKAKFKSRGFQRTNRRPVITKQQLPRRAIYEDRKGL